jgi:hypothetical protein
MKTIVLFLLIVFSSIVSLGQTKYWEDLSCSQKSEILNKCNSSVIRSFYDGQFRPTDNEETQKLLDELVSFNDTVLPLSFYLFNKICAKSDGALAEMVGNYSIEFLVKYPLYLLNYFSHEIKLKIDEPIWKKYALSTGYELYFKNEGTSSLKYNYKDLKKLLVETAKGNKESEETLRIFWQFVDETIKNMD